MLMNIQLLRFYAPSYCVIIPVLISSLILADLGTDFNTDLNVDNGADITNALGLYLYT